MLNVLRREFWTIIFVTVVTLLVWVWAAGETRQSLPIPYATVRFDVPGDDNWVIQPAEVAVNIAIEGSRRAVNEASALARGAFVVETPAEPGQRTLDLTELLREHGRLQRSGVSVLSVDPATVELTIDRVITLEAPVVADLPANVRTQDAPVVDPPTVTVSMPSRVRDAFAGELRVQASLEESVLAQLQPGIPHRRSARLQLSGGVGAQQDVSFEPDSVDIILTIQSRTEQHTLQSVPVQLAGPARDSREFNVQFEPSVLSDVTVTAEASLIERIRRGEMTVIAVVHMSTRAKEQLAAQIAAQNAPATRRISMFAATTIGSDGPWIPITAQLDEPGAVPEVSVTVTHRESSPPSS